MAQITPNRVATANPPKLIGRYELLSLIATGGMGEVWLARIQGAAGFQKTVVIKKILSHLATEPDFVERFLDEGRLVVGLNHGNIAQVFDMGQVEGQYYIAMEHVDGCDLRELVRALRIARKTVPVGLVLYILAQVCEGLAYAHSRTDERGEPLGIIHRDISPSNIMVSRDGAVKLVDFGVAKARSKLSNSVTGAIHGKFQYMSPEQATGKPLDQRSDLFSLGIVAYEMLSGKRPFDGDTDLATLEKIRHTDPEPLRQLRPDVPVAVAELVHHCLEKDPYQRFDTASAVGRRIQEILQATRTVVTAQDLGAVVCELLDDLARATPISLDEALLQQLRFQSGPKTATPGITGHTPTASVANRQDIAVAHRLQTDENDSSASAIKSAHIEDHPAHLKHQDHWSTLVGAFGFLIVTAATVLYLQPHSNDDPPPPTSRTGALVEPIGTTLVRPQLALQAIEPSAPEYRPPLEETARNERRDPDAEYVIAPPQVQANPIPTSRTFQIAGVPENTEIWLAGNGPYVLPHQVVLEADSAPIDGRATAEGYHELRFRIRPDGPRLVRLTLQPKATGKVRFRYFPASARVVIDGKAIPTETSNVVTRSLVPGTHTLEIIGPDGARLTKSFEISAGGTTQLGTLEP